MQPLPLPSSFEEAQRTRLHNQNANYVMKRRQILIGGVMRWCLPSVSRALNRWKEWLVVKKAGKDLRACISLCCVPGPPDAA